MIYIDVDRVQAEETPDRDVLELAVPLDATHRLRLISVVGLLGVREERGYKDGVVGGREH